MSEATHGLVDPGVGLGWGGGHTEIPELDDMPWGSGEWAAGAMSPGEWLKSSLGSGMRDPRGVLSLG